MGSIITLGIEKMEIDWGKNNFYRNHSKLFQTTDIKKIPYYYVDEENDGKQIIIMKDGFSRKLKDLKLRLDLLGYDLNSLEIMLKRQWEYEFDQEQDFQEKFSEIFNAIKKIDVPNLDMSLDTNEVYDFGEYASKHLVDVLKLDHIIEKDVYSFQLSEFLENIDPYIVLRILAENPANLDRDVTWRFADIVESGWGKSSEIVSGIEQPDKILIVTEGSSDLFVLKRTINDLFPNVSDFFDYIDMEDNYPFAGTGNLYKFCVGLCKINIQNKIMVIFDNDTEGVEKYNQSKLLNKPNSLLITKLPIHSDFENMKTIGPQGSTFDNINGRAVAIECFLDLTSTSEEPMIRWTSYNKNLNEYQGALDNKDAYMRKFKKAKITSEEYNTSKLEYLVAELIKQWIDRKIDK